MSEVQCPICEFLLVRPDLNMVEVAGLEVPTADSLAMLQVVDAQMHEHVESHATAEWIKAFKDADDYIAELEAEVERLQQLIAEATETMVQPMPATVINSFTQQAPSEGNPRGLQYPNGRPAVNPNETLIPYIPVATRPEGMVGRKS